jgi:lipopolysaccharide export system permease protein
MRIADRYIGWQVLFGTLFGVTLLTVILVLGQLFKEIRPLLVEQRAPLGLLFRFVVYVIPFSLMFTLPWGFLAATLLSFGRLSGHNELIGFRMAGIGLGRLAAPAIVLSLLFSALCYWLNGTISPMAKSASRNLIYEAVKKDPRALLDPGVVQSRFKDQKVFIESREDGALTGFHLYQLSGDDRDASPVAYVHAGEVDLRVDTTLKQLRLKLSDAFIETTGEDGEVELAFAGEAEPWLFDFSSTNRRRLRASSLTNAEIPTVIAELLELDTEERRRLENPGIEEGQRSKIERSIGRRAGQRRSFTMEVHKRSSLSLACFAFAVIGVPLGVSARRRETSSGLLLSLGVATCYFGVILFIDQFSEAPLPLLVGLLWLPNIACLALGLWLFRRASFR